MNCVDVTNQVEFDAAAARGDCVHASGSAQVDVYGSAQVDVSGSAQVRAYDSAQVRASGSAQVRAYGSAQVRASGSAQVRAYDSAQVRAYDSAQVDVSGSAQVRAYDSAQVEAYDSAQVEASKYVAVTCHGSRIDLTGGVRIDVPDLTEAAAFFDYYGVEPADGKVVLFKGVDAELKSGYGMVYPVGETVTAADWDARPVCGGGLHLSPRPMLTHRYCNPKRYLAVEVDVVDVVVIGGSAVDKVKVPSCRVLYEVNIDGERIDAEAAR